VNDLRVERLAELVVDYSLELGEGDVLRIDGHESAAPLLAALYGAALEAGAHPYVNVEIDGIGDQLLRHGSDAQLAYVPPTEWLEVESLDSHVSIWSEGNTRARTRIDPGRLARYLAGRRELERQRWARIAAGELRWCGTLFPTAAHAQDADMSLAEYEEFVFRACHVDADGAVERWRRFGATLEARAAELASVRELRVVAEDTDLRLGVGGRRWIAASGRLNMPDGEVFTSPVETSVEGDIRFSFPAVYQGREVDDVRLRFAEGRVVAVEAARGGDYLRSLLDLDNGARTLGEVAFGLNYAIDRFTRNILFDEKIGGTMHFALGSSFPQAGGANSSGLHLDLICDLRAGGEVYADGELVWKVGAFLAGPLVSHEVP
jgi:aminopeptidase